MAELIGEPTLYSEHRRSDVDLSKGYHRDLFYVGASRATDRLVVLLAR